MTISQESVIQKALFDMARSCKVNDDKSEFSLWIQEKATSPEEEAIKTISHALLSRRTPRYLQECLSLRGIELEVTESLRGESCWCDYTFGTDTWRVKGHTGGKRWFKASTHSPEAVSLLAHMASEGNRLGAMDLPETAGLLTLLIGYSESLRLCPDPHKSTARFLSPTEASKAYIVSRSNKLVINSFEEEEEYEGSEIKEDSQSFFERLKDGSIEPKSFEIISSPHSFSLVKVMSLDINYKGIDGAYRLCLPICSDDFDERPEKLGISVLPKNIQLGEGRAHGARILMEIVLGIPFDYGLYEGVELPDDLLDAIDATPITIEQIDCLIGEDRQWANERIESLIGIFQQIILEVSSNPRIGNRSSVEVLVNNSTSSTIFASLNTQSQELDADLDEHQPFHQPSRLRIQPDSKWIQLDEFIELIAEDLDLQERFLLSLFRLCQQSEDLIVTIRGIASAPILLNGDGCALCDQSIPVLIFSQCINTACSEFIVFEQRYSHGELDTGLYTTSADEPGSLGRYACKVVSARDLAWNLEDTSLLI